jgi:hypothetical protein
MPNPVCPKCELELRPAIAGIAAEAMATFGAYQLWSADLWECPGCHNQVVYGFGASPVAEHHQENYAAAFDLFPGKPHVRFWANETERAKAVFPEAAPGVVNGDVPEFFRDALAVMMRGSCPFYGKSGIGGVLMDSLGNQCALILDAHAPCRMERAGETPNWTRCRFFNPEAEAQA